MASIKVINEKDLETYRPKDGEVCGIRLTNNDIEYRLYTNETWSTVEINTNGIELNLYDLNKQIISQLPPVKNLYEKITLINQFSKETENIFYMLYGKTLSYFTVFMKDQINGQDKLGVEVVNCLNDLGQIKSIEFDNNGAAIECWVQADGQDAEALYLFPYDLGIIYIKD